MALSLSLVFSQYDLSGCCVLYALRIDVYKRQYDGLSIAWAVCEYLCNKNTHIRTLFATHSVSYTHLGHGF